MSDAIPSLPGGYRPLRRLGAGGMGEVWLAERGGVERAVKLLKLAGGEAGEQDRLRFKREFLALSRLAHPGIVGAGDFFEFEGQLGYAMDYVAGWPLKLYLQDGRWPGGTPAPEWWREPAALDALWRLAGELLEALAHLHAAGFVHRDLKPGNVMVGTDGRLRLIDFGLARPAREDLSITGASEVLGTPLYIAPEQIRNQPLDGRADLYSAGVILYELATGAPPFTGGSVADVLMGHLQRAPAPPRDRNSRISPGHSALILRLLAKAPGGRFATARDALAAMRAALSEREKRRSDRQLDDTAALAAPATGGAGRLLVAPYVGNPAVRAAALEGCARLLAGEGRALLIGGPAGSGKSRLNDEIRAYGAEHGLKVFHGIAVERGGTAGQLFQEVFSAIATHLDRRPEQRATWLGDDGPALALHFPALRRLEGMKAPPPPLEPEAERARLLAACFGFFSRAASAVPFVLLLEDLHWADPLSLDLAAHLIHNFTGAREDGLPPLLLVVNHRDDGSVAGPLGKWLAAMAGAGARSLRLAPFTASELADLLAALLGLDASPPEPFVARLSELTGGNPFFAVETLSAMTEAGELRPAPGGGWDFDDWLAADRNRGLSTALPSSVHSALMRRLAELEETDRAALQAAALIAREFEFAWWLAVCGLGEDALLEVADRAIRRGLLLEKGTGTLQFAHDQLRAALLDGLSGLKRRRLHGKAVSAIEAEGGAERRFALLAEHAIESGDREAALRHGHVAAARCIELYQRDMAATLLERIERLHEGHPPMAPEARLEHLRLKIQLFVIRSSGGEIITIVDEAIALAQRLEKPAMEQLLWRWLGVARDVRGEYPDAIAAEEKSMALARSLNDAAGVGWALHGIGNAHHMMGRGAAALSFFDQSERVARALHDDKLLGNNINNRGILRWEEGDIEGARASFAAALEIAEASGNRGGIAMYSGNLGEMLIYLGRLREAEEILLRSCRLNREMRRTGLQADVMNNLGQCRFLLGDDTGARAALEEALRLARQEGHRYHEAHTHLHLARFHAACAGLPAAEASLEAARGLFREIRHPKGLAVSAAVGAELALLAGDWTRALAKAEEAFRLGEEQGMNLVRALALALRAAAAAESGAPALEAIVEAQAAITTAQNRDAELTCRLLLAGARLAAGDPSSALTEGVEISALAAAAGFRHHTERAESLAARAKRLLGQ